MMKMKNLQRLSLFALIAVTILALNSCNNEKEANPGVSRLQISLIDAPADYEEVNIDIQDVLINRTTDEDGGWESLDSIQTGIYNLLDLTAGMEALLTDSEIAAGRINQIRLVLGNENSVKIEGEIIPLKIPSGGQSGLKINLHQDLVEGITYKLLLDFDAALSVAQDGNSGLYTLKPVIRASTEAESGSITGNISPAIQNVVIYAINGEDVLSTYANSAGQFLIRGVEPGVYELRLEIPSEDPTGEPAVVVEQVEVTLGEATNVGTIELPS